MTALCAFHSYLWTVNCTPNIRCVALHGGISQQMILVSKLHNRIFTWNSIHIQQHNDFAMAIAIYRFNRYLFGISIRRRLSLHFHHLTHASKTRITSTLWEQREIHPNICLGTRQPKKKKHLTWSSDTNATLCIPWECIQISVNSY